MTLLLASAQSNLEAWDDWKRENEVKVKSKKIPFDE
jgi:hypothetical protein